MIHPTVAVIVTCYNQERFIRQALDSLVNQTRKPDEIVVIDGFSHDQSVAVIHEWMSESATPITFIAHDKNHGLCATLNQAMALVSSEFVVTLYGDDWLVPTRLENQASLLAAQPPQVCMIVGGMREVDRRGAPVADHDYGPRIRPLMSLSPEDRVASLVGENVIPSPAVMLRAEHVREVGGYDESLTFDDYDLWLRLLGVYTLAYDPEIVVNYRVLKQSLSRNTNRHGDFLLSEAKMIFKHVGVTSDVNVTIRDRILASAQKLADRRDRRRLRSILKMLSSVDHGWRVRFASFIAALPGGTRLVCSLRLLESRAD